jgi:hypothetical protein
MAVAAERRVALIVGYHKHDIRLSWHGGSSAPARYIYSMARF